MTDKSNNPEQLALAVHLDDEATFANFYAPEQHANAQVVSVLSRQFAADDMPHARQSSQALNHDEQFIFLSGVVGSGVSHLLQAACDAVEKRQGSAQYLPLNDFVEHSPELLLSRLQGLDVVCLDNLQAVLPIAQWQTALFHLFNRLRDEGGRLIMAANKSPHELALDYPNLLPDLQSRLHWGLAFTVKPLDDDDKLKALQLRSKQRGLLLSDEVAQFILHRAPRDMQGLFAVLQTLDKASLAEKRALTIPFVKQILGF